MWSVEQEIFDLCIIYMSTHGLLDNGWSIKVNNSKKVLGETDHDNKIITISKKCYYVDGELVDTILHEISHAISGYENGHNSIWKDIALNIGCSGNICGNF